MSSSLARRWTARHRRATAVFAAALVWLLACASRGAQAANRDADPEPVLTVSSPRVACGAGIACFPLPDPRRGSPPELFEATVRYRRRGAAVVVRYRSPGCGEILDARAGRALLGCAGAPGGAGRALENHVELSLDTIPDDGGFERTTVRLGDERPVVCLSPPCGPATSTVELWPADDGHHVAIATTGLMAAESHQIVFEITRGRLQLDSARRGGGPYRIEQAVRARIDGDVTYRNGRLLFAGSPARWAVDVHARLNGNDGVTLELELGSGPRAPSWTEVDGSYRRTAVAGLQEQLDRVAPDPTVVGEHGLLWHMRRIAEQAFKTTMRYLQPAGRLVELRRTREELQPGLELLRLEYRRLASEHDHPPLGPAEVEVVAVVADAARFAVALRTPCREDDGVVTLNGYAFKHAGARGELLPDAGLVVDGRVVGALRTSPWYANLVIDHGGRAAIESASRFFERGGFEQSVASVLQGTVYVRGGENQRRAGDNPEVNWRSAIGIAGELEGERIILAHTLVPVAHIDALTAYGRGLTQYEMARLLVELGAREAIVLDGGPSAALAVRGRLASGGLRGLPLCIALRERTRFVVAGPPRP